MRFKGMVKLTKLNLKNQKLRRLIRIYKVKRMGIFGSYVNGKPRKNSDVDILVEFTKSADLLDQVGLQLDLQKFLAKKVDIVTVNSLSKYFRDRVIKEVVYL